MFAKLRNEVRRPAVAGDFYPSGAQELESTVGALLSQAKKRRELRGLCGVVAPHAGYVYSGPIAGAAFSLLAHSNDAPNRILLIGPPHYVPVRGIVAPSSSAFVASAPVSLATCRENYPLTTKDGHSQLGQPFASWSQHPVLGLSDCRPGEGECVMTYAASSR